MAYKNKLDLYKYQINRWRKIKLKAIEHLGGSCAHCGYNHHPAAMQFHHKDPETKDVTWDKLRTCSWDKIILELEKCLLLCANCHSIVHSVSKYD